MGINANDNCQMPHWATTVSTSPAISPGRHSFFSFQFKQPTGAAPEFWAQERTSRLFQINNTGNRQNLRPQHMVTLERSAELIHDYVKVLEGCSLLNQQTVNIRKAKFL